MPLQHHEIEAKIKRIEARLETFTSLLKGTLRSAPYRKKRKDGSIYTSKMYHTFVYKDQNGKKAWKRIPEKHLPEVQRKIKAAKAYDALVAQRDALANQLALAGLGEKKNDPSQNPRLKTSTNC